MGVEERNAKLNRLNDDIQSVKNEMDERSSNMIGGSKIVYL